MGASCTNPKLFNESITGCTFDSGDYDVISKHGVRAVPAAATNAWLAAFDKNSAFGDWRVAAPGDGRAPKQI